MATRRRRRHYRPYQPPVPALPGRELTVDEAESLGFDGTGRDGDPRHPYHESDADSHLTRKVYHVAWEEQLLVLEARLGRNADGTLVRWNGWVCPYFTREQIDKYIAWWDGLSAVDGSTIAPDSYAECRWDAEYPEVLHITEGDGEDDVWHDTLTPVDGLYPLGAWSWTWYVCAPDVDPDAWKEVD